MRRKYVGSAVWTVGLTLEFVNIHPQSEPYKETAFWLLAKRASDP